MIRGAGQDYYKYGGFEIPCGTRKDEKENNRDSGTIETVPSQKKREDRRYTRRRRRRFFFLFTCTYTVLKNDEKKEITCTCR